MNNIEFLSDFKNAPIVKYLNLVEEILETNNSVKYKLDRITFLYDYILQNRQNNNMLCCKIEILYWYFKVIGAHKNILDLDKIISQFYKSNYSLLNVKTIEEFEKNFWKIEDIVYDSVQLSSANISSYVYSEDELKYWVSIRKKNADIYSALEFCGVVVGHIGGIKISKEEYNLLRSGILEETSFKNDTKIKNELKYLYIPTIVINEHFRGIYALKKLMNSFMEILSNKITNNAIFILANVYTKEGKHIAEKLNFKYITKHQDGGLIYELKFSAKNKI